MAQDRRLFFLMMRALGVYCIVDGVRAAVETFQGDLESGILYADWMQIWCMRMPNYCSAVVMLGIGGYLLFGGRRLLDHVVPAREGRCWDCDYDLTGNESGRCSECGRVVSQRQPGPRWCAATVADPPWVGGSEWTQRIIITATVLFLASCLLSALLQRFDVIICEPNTGRFWFAEP